MIYRLIRYGEVVGFQRRIGGYRMYSHDMYGWNGKPIEYHDREADTGVRDRNGMRLFLNDRIRIEYYRNPVALRLRGKYDAVIAMGRKGTAIVRVIGSGEERPLEFLGETVSVLKLGRLPARASGN